MPLSEGLRDIRGLDSLPWWALAPGWWAVIAGIAAVLLLLLLVRVIRRFLRVRHHWRSEARRLLRDLEGRCASLDPRIAAGELAQLLRRIAMARCGRRACAGLLGERWLAWLEERDPQGFPWAERGRPLIELPYRPPGSRPSAVDLRPLIEAAREWTKPEPSEPRREPRWPASAAGVRAELGALAGTVLGRFARRV